MENIGNLSVRAPIVLKIQPAEPTRSVHTEVRQLALLDETLAEKRARIAHINDGGEAVYLPDDHGQFTVELSDAQEESQVKGILSHHGFRITARWDAGWQTAEEIEAEAAIDRQLGIAQA